MKYVSGNFSGKICNVKIFKCQTQRDVINQNNNWGVALVSILSAKQKRKEKKRRKKKSPDK